ncbi:uracil-DNA glycosylase-like protein [Tuber borchii]|uniref:Uracil-DNA glycosylase-like protein n=1 Tax=Tuber borchii TaxID=42251 RepID=A0A2T6ZJA8_TUBBO|nr:uracil-DNA glycosylase-like protein [Tuber borchii]
MPPIRRGKRAFQQHLESFAFTAVSSRTRSASRASGSNSNTPPVADQQLAGESSANPNPTPKTTTIVKAKVSVATKPTKESSKPRRRGKQKSTYAPPEKYAHLGGVQDAFAPNLLSVFIGLNPGITTASVGHAYSAPSNHFWKLLHSSGLTPDRICPSTEDIHLPRKYSLGNTNLVARATMNQAELSKEEMDGRVDLTEEKIRKWKPESVCIVGKGIWESIYRAKNNGAKIPKGKFVWGWQSDEDRFGADVEEGYPGARVFVVPSTSGLVAGYSMQFKKDIWRVLGDWVQMRRKERGETAPRTDNLADEPSSSAVDIEA